MTAPVPSDVVTAVAALPVSITPAVTTGEIADTVTAYKALKAIVPAVNAAKSASDLATGTIPVARIAAGSVTLDKLAVDVATQAELNAVSDVANTAASAVAGTALLPPKTVAGTTYTLIASDNSVAVHFTSTTAVALTIPTNAVVPFAVGTVIRGMQASTGAVTVGGTGVTIRVLGTSQTTDGQWAQFELRKFGTNEWVMSGERTA